MKTKIILLFMAVFLPLSVFQLNADEKRYLRYYENPEQILTFANYNAYIRISEMDDLNP